MATSWAWTLRLLVRTDHEGGRQQSLEGDEFNKAAPAPPAPLPAPAAPAQATGENGANPADKHPTPPASEGAEAGAGDPAPSEGAVPRPAAAKPGRRSG